MSSDNNEQSQPTQGTQKSLSGSQKLPLRLKHGSLEVIGYTKDDPMCIKLKVTLRSGEVKAVCKYYFISQGYKNWSKSLFFAVPPGSSTFPDFFLNPDFFLPNW